MVDIFELHWASLNNFIYAPIFLLFALLILKNYKTVKNIVNLLVHKSNQKILFPGFSSSRQKIKTFLLIASLTCIFLALLRPQWGKKENVIVQEGRDLLIVLDVSRSMLAKDLKPNRLEFIKLKIRNLLDKLKFERVGLILFSGSAFLQCPLTSDYPAFLSFLNSVDVETIASGTTSIDQALLKATEIFSNSADRKNKLVLLATDGEDFSTNLNSVKQRAKKENIKVLSWGIGSTQGAPIPKLDKFGKQIGHEEEKGKVALSKLNEEKLKQISSYLQGHYIKSTNSDSDLNYISSLIESFEKESFEDKKLSLYQDQYPWFLGLAFVMLLLEWLL
ncbi:MAG: VWA domain-containing protein [bacterium]